MKLDEQELKLLAQQITPLVTEQAKSEQKELWQRLDDVREPLFANKNRTWISVHIFQKFPEVLKENNPNGWVIGAFGKGKRTKVFTPLAVKWLEDNYSHIDWES